MTHDVAIIAYDGCVASNVYSYVDMFETANQIIKHMGGMRHSFRHQIVSTSTLQVRSYSNKTILADCLIEEMRKPKVLLIPGLGISSEKDIKSTLKQLKKVSEKVNTVITPNMIVGANCSGTFVLAASGQLNHRKATTTWWLADTFRHYFPLVELNIDEVLVEDKNLITSGAMTSYLDLGLHLIGKLGGPSLMRLCGQYMIIDGGKRQQRPYITPWLMKNRDKLIESADRWVRNKLRFEIKVDDLADYLGVSSRTLNRRFHNALKISPQEFIQAVKIEHAKTLLETTDENTLDISFQLGYQEENSFRRVFKSHTGLTPPQYRRQFKASDT